VVARRAALERVGGFSTERYLLNFGEDWELWLRLAYAGRVGYVAEPLAVYRAHTPDGTEPPFDTARYERMLRQVGRALGAAARRRLRAAAAERYRLLAAEARAAGNGAAALRLRLRALRFRALG
jgi:GT2 family glycosyltransferase